MAAPIAVKTWMEFESLCFVFYTIQRPKCVEVNNDDLGHNKHIINGRIFLEGSIVVATKSSFFPFCQPLLIEFIPQHPQSNLLQPFPPPLDRHPNSNYLWPPPLPLRLLHFIFNLSEKDKAILRNSAVSDLWPTAVAHAKWGFLDDPSENRQIKTMSLYNKAKLPDGFSINFRLAIILWCMARLRFWGDISMLFYHLFLDRVWRIQAVGHMIVWYQMQHYLHNVTSRHKSWVV